MKKKGKIVATVLAATMLFNASFVWSGGWVDDWLTQKTVTGPSSFQDSRRGFYTGGSFSARWPQNNDHPVTISKPGMKAGCGGIDLFMGGFSFTSMDYLGKKLQNIMNMAPAVAFSIALSTLAPQVDKQLKEFNKMIDDLNKLQLDDCKSAQTLVSLAASPFTPEAQGGADAAATAALTNYGISSGVSNLYNDFHNTWSSEAKANGGASPTAQGQANAATAGCPADVINAFGTPGSLLDNLAVIKNIPSAYVQNMRALLGDLIISTPNTTGSTYAALYTGTCGNVDFEDVVLGNAQVMDSNGNCTSNPSTNNNLVQYVTNSFVDITTQIKNRTQLTTDQQNLLASIPLPVFPALRAAVISGTENTIISQLATPAAMGLGYKMMLDLALLAHQEISVSKQIQSAGKDLPNCQLSLLTPITEKAGELEKNLWKKMDEVRSEYLASVGDTQAVQSLVSALQKFDQIVTSEMGSRALGQRGTVSRATGKS
jgi:conjugative transfer pilus assembly protein TraH